ncbi:Protein of unknown function [Pyronema omphalodes CBS 100304]|uniref:Uncharacterized protein n=1 Tax=Pyronema omphalodes (strain CBS 100304) TaxID=1076935 RepID=U4KVN4_PYROM|nr:Protein of unknown function [Pyronema omphalodes CBS 100304]
MLQSSTSTIYLRDLAGIFR